LYDVNVYWSKTGLNTHPWVFIKMIDEEKLL